MAARADRLHRLLAITVGKALREREGRGRGHRRCTADCDCGDPSKICLGHRLAALAVLVKEEEFISRRLKRAGRPPSIKAVYVPQRTCLPITRRAAGLLVP